MTYDRTNLPDGEYLGYIIPVVNGLRVPHPSIQVVMSGRPDIFEYGPDYARSYAPLVNVRDDRRAPGDYHGNAASLKGYHDTDKNAGALFSADACARHVAIGFRQSSNEPVSRSTHIYRLRDYRGLRQVLRWWTAREFDAIRLERSATAKLEDFFIALGTAYECNLADYLKSWKFKTRRVGEALTEFDRLEPDLPVRCYGRTCGFYMQH